MENELTFQDLLQVDDFRDFSLRYISQFNNDYEVPSVIPKLYKYRAFSGFTVNDLLSNSITITAISEFNDLFDGAIHQYGLKDEIEDAAEEKWNRLTKLQKEYQLPGGVLKKEDIIKPYKEYYKRESRLKFREHDYLGSHICCFLRYINVVPLCGF